jgi:hypothetical protein
VFSPDGRTLAMGSAGEGEIWYLDSARPTVLRRQAVVPGHLRDGGMEIEVEAWPSPSRLIAVATVTGTWWAPHPSQLLVLDPADGRVLRRTPLRSSVEHAINAGGGRVALLLWRHGFAQVVVVEPDGSAWALVLRRIGLGGPDGMRVAGRYYRPSRQPGFATDRLGRVFVAASDRPIAEIDLRTRHVRYHDVDLPRHYLSYPPPFVPNSVGPSLRFGTSARWLGDHQLAIGGFDTLPAPVGRQAGEREADRVLQIVDTRSWRRTRSVRATGCLPARRLVLCTEAVAGDPPDRKGMHGASLVAYDAHWRRLYEKPAPELWWGLAGGRLFAGSYAGERISELDPRTGAKLRRIAPSPLRNELWPLELFGSTPR